MLQELELAEHELTKDRLFSDSDRQLLASYKPTVQGLAELLGKHCEVILHSLENLDKSVIQIANGYSAGGVEGAPISELALSTLKNITQAEQGFTQVYFSKSKDDAMLRSITIAIRNPADKVIGLLCINLNLGASFFDFASELMQSPRQEKQENFTSSVEELVNSSIEDTIRAVNKRHDLANNAKNKQIVVDLHAQGIFDIKDAINILAQRLNISKHTVYLYIRKLKAES